MPMPPKDPDARAFFHALLPRTDAVVVRPMFGEFAAFVNGNMFAGVCGSEVLLRLPEADRNTLMQEPGTGVFAPMDRPMKEYVTLGPDWRATPEKALPWMERAFEWTASLPPKEKKPRRPGK